MRMLLILFAVVSIAFGLSGCIIVEHGHHGYQWEPACYGYGCW